MTFGSRLAKEYAKGKSEYVGRHGRFVIQDYVTSIDCEERGYGAVVVKFLADQPEVKSGKSSGGANGG
jgi:hypothetical protein